MFNRVGISFAAFLVAIILGTGCDSAVEESAGATEAGGPNVTPAPSGAEDVIGDEGGDRGIERDSAGDPNLELGIGDTAEIRGGIDMTLDEAFKSRADTIDEAEGIKEHAVLKFTIANVGDRSLQLAGTGGDIFAFDQNEQEVEFSILSIFPQETREGYMDLMATQIVPGDEKTGTVSFALEGDERSLLVGFDPSSFGETLVASWLIEDLSELDYDTVLKSGVGSEQYTN